MARRRGPSRRAAPSREAHRPTPPPATDPARPRPGAAAAEPALPGIPPGLRRTAPGLGLAALLVATALAYQPALPGPFVLDDWGSIEANMKLRTPEAVRVPSLPELLGPARAVTEITFALDYRAARLDPVRFHWTGLLFHLAAVVAAFGFLSALARRAGHPAPRGLALAVSALFALHPIQAESVAYAAQRSEAIASLFYLLTLLLLDGAAAGWPGPRAWASWAGAVGAWVVGMGAKTIAISAPGAFVAGQLVVAPAGERGLQPLRRRGLRALLLAAPILALAAWSAVLHLRGFEAAPSGGAGFHDTQLGAGAYFLTQLRVQWLYLGVLAWPPALAFDRSFTPSTGLDGATLAAAAGVAALVALAGWLWVRAERADGPRPAERLASFGILFWFVALSPTSSVVPVVDLAVEHRAYLASIGPFLAVAAGADALLRRLLPPRRAALAGAAAALAVALLLGGALVGRARTWGSAEALWLSAAVASPDNARAWTNLGLARARRGDLAGAEEAYRRGWAVVKEPARAISLARNHAAVLLDSRRYPEALAVLERGLAMGGEDPSLRANRAAALAQAGRVPEAVAEARRAAALAPGDPLMRNVLGQALSVGGDPAAALDEFRAAEALDPGNPLYPVEAGVTLLGLGRRDEACAAFRRGAEVAGGRPLPLDAARHAAKLGCPLPGTR